jgi:hypothetical protein
MEICARMAERPVRVFAFTIAMKPVSYALGANQKAIFRRADERAIAGYC